ncbi:MAG: DNA mismatch repair endonuclease MutL, partial [Clostridia bacterium]|nr:DNA mismatch repair endonuclease MutL [Clostridia bacterium]
MDKAGITIQRLSREVIGQIAAGEVVERPASVVKELVENSIDAGATAITVELRGGGVEYLRVTDNGSGIPSSQVRMAFERHATSKIAGLEDLYGIQTLGFRGEALAAITAVAKVSCTTRAARQDFGIQAKAEGGEVLDIREAATPIGTTLLVKDLFFNVPVRLKFLKKPSLETAMVTDFLTRLILSRPDISFRYVNEGKTVYQSVGDGTVESALLCCVGKDVFRGMKKVRGNRNGILVKGYVGVGELARGNRQQQSFFVNGRFFRDVELSKALEDACRGSLGTGRFPICALYLQLPHEKVDVNVHPNKLEVRFQDSNSVADAVKELVRAAIEEQSLEEALLGSEAWEPLQTTEESIQVMVLKEDGTAVPEAEKAPQLVPAKMDAQACEKNSAIQPAIIPAIQGGSVFREGQRAPARASFPANGKDPGSMLPEESNVTLHYVGSAFQTYLVFETKDRLLWVDQHAAHERIVYDRMWKQYEDTNISQRL